MSTTATNYTPAVQAKRPKGRGRSNKRQEMLAGYGFVLPAFVALLLFLIVPILAALVLVFMNYDVLSPPTFAGFSNITRLFSDQRMVQTYWNTFRFVFFATLFNNVLGLLLAMAVNRAMHPVFKYVFRTAIFFPVLTTAASLALVFNFLLTQDRGVVN